MADKKFINNALHIYIKVVYLQSKHRGIEQ